MDSKSNQITAIPALLDPLAVNNSIVTLDAMGCRTAIAQKIIDRGADCLLALKANHRQAHQVVAEYFNQACFDRGARGQAALDECDDAHGRLVRRRIFVNTEAARLEALRCWPGLHAVVAVETIRSVKTVAELRCYLPSGHDAPEVLARAIRKHWTIENKLHWLLDVTFREDESRVRDRTAARNLAVLRKIALNLISRDQASKTSKRGSESKPPGTTPTCSKYSGSSTQSESQSHASP